MPVPTTSGRKLRAEVLLQLHVNSKGSYTAGAYRGLQLQTIGGGAIPFGLGSHFSLRVHYFEG